MPAGNFFYLVIIASECGFNGRLLRSHNYDFLIGVVIHRTNPRRVSCNERSTISKHSGNDIASVKVPA